MVVGGVVVDGGGGLGWFELHVRVSWVAGDGARATVGDGGDEGEGGR